MKSEKSSYTVGIITIIIVVAVLMVIIFTKAFDTGGVITMAIIGVAFIVGSFSRSPSIALLILIIVGLITGFFTKVELKIFNIPRKYGDAIWLCNGILFFGAYFITLWYKRENKANP